MNSYLINFNRTEQVTCQPDWWECIANIGLGFLRLNYGKTVTVKPLNATMHRYAYEEQASYSPHRSALALGLILLPLTLAITLIGYVALRLSSSHRALVSDYQQYQHDQLLEVRALQNLKKFRGVEKSDTLASTTNIQSLDLAIQPQLSRQIDLDCRSIKGDISALFCQTITIKIKALQFNQKNLFINRLIKDIYFKIFDLVDTRDLCNLSLTCYAFSQKIESFCRNRIEGVRTEIFQLIEYANILDSHIHSLVDHLRRAHYRLIKSHALDAEGTSHCNLHKTVFKFDVDYWKQTVCHLRTPSWRSRELIDECRLDLIEALAEYNIMSEMERAFAGWHWSAGLSYRKPTMLSQIKIDELDEPLKCLLNEAKGTLKGDMFIRDGYPFAPSVGVILDKKSKESSNFYIKVCMTNLECTDWANRSYDRHIKPQADAIHIDWLKGKKEGDRFVIPPQDGKEQIILRCLALSYKFASDGPFEQAFAIIEKALVASEVH